MLPAKEFIEKLFWIQSQVQMNHWAQKVSGFKHEVLGNYYKSMNEFIDQLVETYGGIFGKEAITLGESLYAVHDDTDNVTLVIEILKILETFRENFKEYPAIINVLDDMLTETFRTKYLLEFN